MKTFAIAFLFLLLSVVLITYSKQPSPSTLGENIDIIAQVNTCILNLTVYPEGRVPPINNWGTNADITVYNSLNSLQFATSITTDNFGQTTINNCLLGSYPEVGLYKFKVKAIAHLTRVFTNINSFYAYQSNIDLTSKLLQAGETSIVVDDYINSLDLATQIKNFFLPDYQNDLNADGIVNVLDINLSVNNLFKAGETL